MVALQDVSQQRLLAGRGPRAPKTSTPAPLQTSTPCRRLPRCRRLEDVGSAEGHLNYGNGGEALVRPSDRRTRPRASIWGSLAPGSPAGRIFSGGCLRGAVPDATRLPGPSRCGYRPQHAPHTSGPSPGRDSHTPPEGELALAGRPPHLAGRQDRAPRRHVKCTSGPISGAGWFPGRRPRVLVHGDRRRPGHARRRTAQPPPRQTRHDCSRGVPVSGVPPPSPAGHHLRVRAECAGGPSLTRGHTGAPTPAPK